MSFTTLSKKGGRQTSDRQTVPSSSRNNLAGQSAHTRHQYQTAIYDPDGSKTRKYEQERLLNSKTDWDLLKEEHQFIREEEARSPMDDSSESISAYGRSIAKRYEESLFKEYALVDLKHYKSGKVALRWRTPEEVIDSIGSSTCGSLRCAYHLPPLSSDAPSCPPLEAFELPFSYVEKGEPKTALVKVVCCKRCKKKLLYGTSSKVGGADRQPEESVQTGSRSRARDRMDEERDSSSPEEKSSRKKRREDNRDDRRRRAII